MGQSELEALFEHWWGNLAPEQIALHCQYRFMPGRKYAFDYAYPDKQIAVEIDGGQFVAGGGRHNQDSDRVKLNHAAALGWRVFRFSGTMLKRDPQGCINIVLKAIRGE